MTIPLQQQIEEVEREIRTRARLYPNWVEKKRLKQETADRKLADLRAAQTTLMWLDANLHWIKPEAVRRQELARQQAELATLESDPAVQAVKDEFPGAVVTGVTTRQPEDAHA